MEINEEDFISMFIWKMFVDKYKDLYLELCNNHIGAMNILDTLIVNLDEKNAHGIMLTLKDLNIKGIDIYTLYADCCRKDLVKFVINLAALDVGVYTDAEIRDNFRINNIDLEYPTDISYYEMNKEREKFFKYMGDRVAAYPFLYDQVKLEDFTNNIEKMLQNPKNEEFINYVKENRKHYWARRFIQTIPGLYARGIKIDGNTLSFKINEYEIEDENYIGIYNDAIKIDYNKLKDVTINMKHIAEVFTTNKKFYDQRQYRNKDSYTIFEWLMLAKDKFLPSFAVVKNMPKEDREKFYINNNNKRYGEMILNSKATDFLHHEGLFKISYILGLFSENGNESLRAFNFLNNQLIAKLSLDDIHKFYGHIQLTEIKFNKNFADFFMINFAKDPNCFNDENDVNKTAELYYNFDEILSVRPEKEINTTTDRKRLTPEIALSTLDYILNDICYKLKLPDEYTDFVKNLSKYTGDVESIKQLIDFYDIAKNIKEEDVKIPLIAGNYNNLNFKTLKKTEPEAYVVGYKTNCCFIAYGASESSFKHSITSLDSRVIVVEGEKTYLQGWIWYDEENKFACIDNIEGYAKNTESALQTMIVAVKKLFKEMKKDFSLNKINVGLRYVKEPIKDYLYLLLKNGLIKEEPNANFHQYCTKNNLYTDAYSQLTLADDELILKNDFASISEETNQNQKQ